MLGADLNKQIQVGGACAFVECGHPSPYYETPSGVLVYIGTGESFAPACHLFGHLFMN